MAHRRRHGPRPARYFVIVPNMLGNGLSSSPSNMPPPYNGPRFPDVRVQDNVRAQHKLVTERFGIERLVAVIGWSMGAGQTYQWAVSYPEMVPRILPFCGSARTSRAQHRLPRRGQGGAHGRCRVEGRLVRRAALAGLRAFARVYAGWGFSQAFYWDEVYERLGLYVSSRTFSWVSGGVLPGRARCQQPPHDAVDLAAGDIGMTDGFDGDTERALRSIQAARS